MRLVSPLTLPLSCANSGSAADAVGVGSSAGLGGRWPTKSRGGVVLCPTL